MTNMEKALLFGSIGAGALQSAVGARQHSQNQAQNELDLMVQRQLAALQNKQQTSQNLQDQRQQGWKDQTSQSPLGGEQSFLQKQRLAQVLFPQIANFKPAMPTDPGVAGAYVPPTNLLGAFGDPRFLDTFSDQATATSLADRRKLMTGLNPDYEFSSLGNFGLDSSFDGGVNRAQQDAAGRRQAYENTQAQLADAQLALAGQNQQQGQQQQQQKGGGVKGFLGGLLKTAAPFASFIPGVGPIAAIGLGAAGGALGNKLQGGGLASGAVQGGVGAGIGAAGKSLASGQGLNPFNNKAGGAMLDAAGKAVTSASQVGPQLSEMAGSQMMGPSFAPSGPYNAAGDINKLLSAPQSSFRQLPQQNNMSSIISGLKPPVAPQQGPPQDTRPSGFNTQGYPLRNAGPYTGPGSTSAGISANPTGTMLGLEIQNMIDQQPFIQAMRSPMGMLAGGAVAGQYLPWPNTLPNQVNGPLGPAPGEIGRMSRAADLGIQSRNAAFDQMWQQGMKAGNPLQDKVAQLLQSLSNARGSAATATNTAAQGAYRNVPGRVTQQIDPKLMEQILLSYTKKGVK